MKLLSTLMLCTAMFGIASAQESILSSHILDISQGLPAENVVIVLEKKSGETWNELEKATTNQDGRVNFHTIKTNNADSLGVYRLNFYAQDYFKKQKLKTFYPEVNVTFEINDETSHYHVPITLSPYGYSTYRGS